MNLVILGLKRDGKRCHRSNNDNEKVVSARGPDRPSLTLYPARKTYRKIADRHQVAL